MITKTHRASGTPLRVQNRLNLVNLAVSVTICGTRIITLSRLLRGISMGTSRSRIRLRGIRVAFKSHGMYGELKDAARLESKKRKLDWNHTTRRHPAQRSETARVRTPPNTHMINDQPTQRATLNGPGVEKESVIYTKKNENSIPLWASTTTASLPTSVLFRSRWRRSHKSIVT